MEPKYVQLGSFDDERRDVESELDLFANLVEDSSPKLPKRFLGKN